MPIRHAVGRAVILNGTAFTIVGVTPKEFFGERVRRPPDFWVPLIFQPQIELRPSTLDRSDTYWLSLIGRLSSGATRAQAQAAATASLRQFLTNAAGAKPSDGADRADQGFAHRARRRRRRRVGPPVSLFGAAAHSSRGRRARPADRLRERRQPAAVTRGGAAGRDDGPHGARRDARAAGRPAADGKPAPVGARRNLRRPARPLAGRRRRRRHRRQDVAPSRVARRPGPRVHAWRSRALPACCSASRPQSRPGAPIW